MNPLPGFIKYRRWVAAEQLWGAPCTPAPSNRIEYLSEEKLRCLSQSCWFRSARRGWLPHSGLEKDPSENHDLPVSDVFSLDPVQSVPMAFSLTVTSAQHKATRGTNRIHILPTSEPSLPHPITLILAPPKPCFLSSSLYFEPSPLPSGYFRLVSKDSVVLFNSARKKPRGNTIFKESSLIPSPLTGRKAPSLG